MSNFTRLSGSNYFNSSPIFKIFDFIELQKSDLYIFYKKHFILLNSLVCNLRNHLRNSFTKVDGSSVVSNRSFWPVQVLGWCIVEDY